MDYQNIMLQIEQYRATITLNRPEVRNAFNDQTIAELTHVFQMLAKNDEVRVIVLAAEGKAFCAGADLNWMRAMADYSDEENRQDAKGLAQMLYAIYTCPKPTVAQIQGDVFAGGMGLISACDIAVAATQARFCLSEVKLGLVPATISPYVVRAMGARAAQRYCLTGEVFSAEDAAKMGLLHEVVEADALVDTVKQIAHRLMLCGPHAQAVCKRLLDQVVHHEISDELIDYTVNMIAEIRASDEGKEGVQSFLNKRQAAWLPERS